MSDVIHIDGSHGEGGGQIIRTALALAAITGRTVEMVNIRAGRQKPGLQPQHLAAVRAAAAVCDAAVSGATAQSLYLHFHPRTAPRPDSYLLDIGTAGAVALVLQTALLPLALANGTSQLRIIGGTHVPLAPTMEYMEFVYLPLLRRAGVHAHVSYSRAGYRARGGGEVQAEITPTGALTPLTLRERGKLLALKATILTSELPTHVSERGAAAVLDLLRDSGLRVAVEQRQRPSAGPGAAVILCATCENGAGGFSALGERGKPMEVVAREACLDFLRWWESGAAVDAHLGDQLVLPLALAGGESCWSVPVCTEHLRSVIWVVQQFLPIAAEINEGEGRVEVRLRGAA